MLEILENRTVVGFFVAAFIISVLLADAVKTAKKHGKFRSRTLMTDNELEFFYRLVKALPDYLIFPQVSMQALLEPASTDKRAREADRLRIAQQRVDYVICDPAGAVLAIVELDDRTHERKKEKDTLRDGRLKQAGIPTIRYQSKSRPSPSAIKRDVMRLRAT